MLPQGKGVAMGDRVLKNRLTMGFYHSRKEDDMHTMTPCRGFQAEQPDDRLF